MGIFELKWELHGKIRIFDICEEANSFPFSAVPIANNNTNYRNIENIFIVLDYIVYIEILHFKYFFSRKELR